jgi:excisionase family DNA binding protein
MDGVAKSIRKTAEALDVSQPTVHRWARKGMLIKVKVGGKSLITTDSIRALVQA